MQWVRGAILMVLAAAAGCDRLRAAGPAAPPAAERPAPEAQPIADLEAFNGRTYRDFAAAHSARFSAAGLGLSAEDGARLERIMSQSNGALLQGGGAEALVFRGCAESGCADGLGVVAVDAATGVVFVALKEPAGEDILIPNERLEALLRLNAPSRNWADVATAPPARQTTPATLNQP